MNHPNKYLQQRSTGSYLRPDGGFTVDVAEARPVRNITEALSLCRQHRLTGMDLLMKFSREEYDIRLEIV